MKRNRLNKLIWPTEGLAGPHKTGLKMILAVVPGLFIFLVLAPFAKEVGNKKIDAPNEKTQFTSTKAEPVSEMFKEGGRKEQAKPKTTVVSPNGDNLPAEVNPMELPQAPLLSAPAAGDKGRQIKWQLFSSGSAIGGASYRFQLGRAPNDRLGGTVGQFGVGSGSSESFGTSGGFWQAPGGVRGDVNGDGAINVGDVIHLVNFLYRDGPPPFPAWAGDFDCDGATNVGDVVELVNYLYRDGPPPSC